MLNDHPPGARVAKRALLFTNRDDPRRPAKTVENSFRMARVSRRPPRRRATLHPPTHAGDDFRSARRDDITARVLCARWDETTRTRRTPTRPRPRVRPVRLTATSSKSTTTTRTTTCHARRRSRLTTRTFAPRTFARRTSTATRWWRVPRIAERLTLDFEKSARRRGRARATLIRRRGPRRHRRARARATRRGATPHTRRVTLSRPLGGVRGHRVRVQRGRRVRRRRISREDASSTAVREWCSPARKSPRRNARAARRARTSSVPTARRDTQTVGADRAAGAVQTPADEATQPGATAAFAALVRWRRDASSPSSRSRAWANETRVRVARRWYRPRRKTGHHGLHVVYLPFADDVRYPERATTREFARAAKTTTPRLLGATEAQIRAAEQAVDALAVPRRSVGHLQPDARAASSRVGVAGAEPRVDRGRRRRRATRRNRRGRTNSPPWRARTRGGVQDGGVRRESRRGGGGGDGGGGRERNQTESRGGGLSDDVVDYKAPPRRASSSESSPRGSRNTARRTDCRRRASWRRSWSASPRTRRAREYAPRQLEYSRPNRTYSPDETEHATR